MTDRELLEQAMLRLAVKTRERIDAGVISVYLDDEEIQAFPTADVLAGLKSLEKSEWFPKFGEVVKACKRAQYYRLYGTPEEQNEREMAKRLAVWSASNETREEAQARSQRVLAKIYAATHREPPKWMQKPITEDHEP